MARQKGIIKLKGTIGDITFYKTQDGHLAREKGGVDANRIANDPAFNMSLEDLQKTMDPSKYVGRSPEQVDEFLAEVINPILEENKEILGMSATINV